ncbi:MAG TPA: SRPBCC domain-containing protein [Salinimicrobium sp.]|nr:SRPBCC domain-containing protein [Salinimicrobium sp.]
MKKLQIKTNIQISKSINEVFEAIVDPLGMTNYFISKSNGRMETGKSLIWNFPEFDVDVPIKVTEVVPNQKISFLWDGAAETQTLVEIFLTPTGSAATLVSITEKEMENDESGIKWLQQNTEGWANFSACLKAYLEYGINLRKGAFDFMAKS